MYCITFAGGCYGNFVAWTLEWMQGRYPLDYRPFTAANNSHNWRSTYRGSIEEAVAHPIEGACLHPVHNETDSIVTSIEKLLTVYDKVVVLYPELEDFLWSCNNKLTKIYSNEKGWINNNSKYIGLAEWESKEPWEYRESLSFFLYNQHMSEIRYKDIINYSNSCMLKIEINQIRDDFNNTFNKLSEWLQIENVRSDDDLTKLHKDWIQNEPYLYKDRLIKEMFDAIINNIDIPMNDCSIFDQADIQRRLRNAGYEIKCHSLNEWPGTTTQLRELIYEAE
jgi:hypothetical protein